MRDVTNANFGLLIAYLLPGFVALLGISLFSETVRAWLTVSGPTAPTVGGFLYVTLGSLAAGLTVSTVRWAIVDTIHAHTGLKRPNWNYAVLHTKVAAYEFLVGNLYRYFQFYSNMLTAIAFTFIAFLVSKGWQSTWHFVAFVLIETIFWLGSRDTLRNFYSRGYMLLGQAGNEALSPNTPERD